MSQDEDQRASEAAAWLARLDTRAITTDELDEFYRWRRQPGNAEAYAQVESLWRQASALGDDRDVAAAVRDALSRPRARGTGRRLDRRTVIAAAVAAPLAAGGWWWATRAETYCTGVGEQLLVRLDDGSRVRLNTDSEIVTRFTPDRRDLELRRGQAFFEVHRDTARPFAVRAGDTAVEALGTQFDVRAQAGSVRIVLAEGRVEVTGARDGDRVELTEPGDSAVSDGDGETVRGHVDVDIASGWTGGRMIFRQTPLGEAIAEANRYTAVPIVLKDEALRAARVDGVFETGDTDAFVAAMTALFSLKSEHAGDAVVLSPA